MFRKVGDTDDEIDYANRNDEKGIGPREITSITLFGTKYWSQKIREGACVYELIKLFPRERGTRLFNLWHYTIFSTSFK